MGGPRCGAAGGGNAPRECVHGVSTTKPGASAAGKAASDGSAVPRSCAARLLWGAAEPLRRMLRILLEA